MKSIDQLRQITEQCPQCKSQGEIYMIDEDRIRSLEIEQKLLTVKHIKQLEKEIENLLKQKATLQDKLDSFAEKEKQDVSLELQSNLMGVTNDQRG